MPRTPKTDRSKLHRPPPELSDAARQALQPVHERIDQKVRRKTLDKLTVSERRFIDAYMTPGVSKTAALKMAGLSYPAIMKPDGQRDAAGEQGLKPHLLDAIAEYNLATQRDVLCTRRDVFNGFMDAVHAATTSTELTLAWREIAKLIGAYAPQELNVNVSGRVEHVQEKFEKMSDAELARLAGEDFIDAEFDEV